jgi:hypothetical protein
MMSILLTGALAASLFTIGASADEYVGTKSLGFVPSKTGFYTVTSSSGNGVAYVYPVSTSGNSLYLGDWSEDWPVNLTAYGDFIGASSDSVYAYLEAGQTYIFVACDEDQTVVDPKKASVTYTGNVASGAIETAFCDKFSYDYSKRMLTLTGSVLDYDEISPLQEIDFNLQTLILDGFTSITCVTSIADMNELQNIVIPASVTTISPRTVGYVIDWDVEGNEETGNAYKKLDLTIYGYPGTTAETYANENGFAFVDLTDHFIDVPAGQWYSDPVSWAVDQSITNGSGNYQFTPTQLCSRGQIATFLWRLAGSPEPTIENPFTDLGSESSYYYKAVLWAYENGITTGTSATTFSPDAQCTRSQIVTFLWRAAGTPAPQSAVNPFADISEDTYYTSAVLWAVENGITTGTSATSFSPLGTCSRAEAVTFLYRYAN